MDYTFDASQVHFRAALDQARLARERHRDAADERARGLSGMEPQARETDAAILTVMLTQAAAESYGSWVHLKAGRHPGRMNWRKAWREFPEAAAKLGKPHDFELAPDSLTVLEYLATWRNYLMHTDPNNRDKLHETLVARNAIAPEAEEKAIVALLNADLAEWATTEFEKLFRWAHARTGVEAPFTEGAWPGEGFRRLSSAAAQEGRSADGAVSSS